MIQFLTSLRHRQYVRPWALASPVIVLIIALPLLRPLLHPTELSMQEATRLAAVQSLVEHHQLTPAAANLPADQPAMPVFTLLLAGPYWLLVHFGYRLSSDTAMVSYLLTLLCATIPAAGAAGLVYRMGRIFALSRPLRCGLGLSVVLGSGLISYATVINPHAPAAFLVLAAASSLIRSGAASKRSGAAIAMAGFFAALAAAIDFSALPFLCLLPLALLTIRAPLSWRAGALLFFVIGAFPLALLHGVLSTNILNARSVKDLVVIRHVPAAAPERAVDDDDEDLRPSVMETAGHGIIRMAETLFGSHGLLSHFPVIIFACVGVGSVVRRHWPGLMKGLAIMSVCGAVVVIGWVAATGPDNPTLMFGNRFFIAFSPLLLFWGGAWLRQSHRPAVWSIAGVLMAFSAMVGVIGATNPYPPQGYGYYTPLAAIHRTLGK